MSDPFEFDPTQSPETFAVAFYDEKLDAPTVEITDAQAGNALGETLDISANTNTSLAAEDEQGNHKFGLATIARRVAVAGGSTLALFGFAPAAGLAATRFSQDEISQKQAAYDAVGQQVEDFQNSINPDPASHIRYYKNLAGNAGQFSTNCTEDMYGNVSYSLTKSNPAKLKVTIERKDAIDSEPIVWKPGTDYTSPLRPFETRQMKPGDVENFNFACKDTTSITSYLELWKKRIKEVHSSNHVKVKGTSSISLSTWNAADFVTGPQSANYAPTKESHTDTVYINVPKAVAAIARQGKLFLAIRTQTDVKLGLFRDKTITILQPVNPSKTVTVDAGKKGSFYSGSHRPIASYNPKGFPLAGPSLSENTSN